MTNVVGVPELVEQRPLVGAASSAAAGFAG